MRHGKPPGKSWSRRLISLIALFTVLVAGSIASANYFMHEPDGTVAKLKEGTFQPDLSQYRTKLDVKVLDRRWVAKEALEAANQMFFIGQSGFADMVRAAFPLAHKPAFHWVTHQEAYWYARWQLMFGMGFGHQGIHMVHGPYFTLKSLELTQKGKSYRDRGERLLSPKDVMMDIILPNYWKRIGIWRPLHDDTQPAYLIWESGDPHFTSPQIPTDTFWDPQSSKKGKFGVPEYFFNERYSRWSADKQSRYIDFGADATTMKRGSMWIAYMFKSTHEGYSPSSGFTEHAQAVNASGLGYEDKLSLLGNDAEEGFKGVALTLTNLNRVLAWKSQLVADEEGNLGGIDPFKYNPEAGRLRYFPHRIWPNMMMAGDLPERHWNFDINDPRSLLWDQSQAILGLTEFYHQTYRLPEVFSANPPVDGGLVERDLGVVARGLANMVVKNIFAMHTNNGLMVSEWQPKQTKWWLHKSFDHPGSGDTVSVMDSAYGIRALREYVDRMRDPLGNPKNPQNPDLEPELTKKALTLLTAQADFLLKVQEPDGSFCEAYHVVTGACVGEKTLSEPQFWAVGALTSAYHATGNEKYTEAARKAWNYVNEKYWHEPSGLYRTRLNDDTVIITPMAVAGQLWAYREIMFATPIQLIEPLIDRFPRWWVQTVNMTGFIQSEENRTGELCHGVCSADYDNDGIPWTGKGHGRFGIAPGLAAKIAVNLGGPNNEAFAALGGEKHDPEMYGGKVVYRYAPKSSDQALKGILLPVKLDVKYDKDGSPEAPWVARGKMTRFDGLTYPVPPAIPFKRGSNFTGRQIVEMNCAHCHGYTGEGITGIPWKDSSLHRTRDDMFEVPKNGRFTRIMPEWGRGLGDEMGSTLTDEEIYRIVDYVQSREFQQEVYQDYNGIANPNQPTKDAYFYISLSYLHGKKTPATEEDIRLVMDAQERAIREKRPIDIMALLREAEKGRTVEYASDPEDLFVRIADFFSGQGLRRQENHQKAYPGFFETLTYTPESISDFKNVRPLEAEKKAAAESPAEDAKSKPVGAAMAK